MQVNEGMSHGHHPDLPDMHTGFAALGAGIRAGASVSMLPLTCIAPLVAELLVLGRQGLGGAVRHHGQDVAARRQAARDRAQH